MTLSPTELPRVLPGATPEETLRAFRAAYSLEEVQAELWRCLHPRLLASFRELDPESPAQLAALYESLELLISAVYQLPDLPAPAGGTDVEPVQPEGGNGHD